MRIAISGPPGSGKTTISKIVAEKLDYECVFVGQIFRQMAQERKIDLDKFGRLAEEDETIDRELDSRMLAIAKANNNIVIEGRLSGALLKMSNVNVFAAYVTASEEVRAKRIAERESKDPETVLKEMRIRERSEKKRYFSYYGIDSCDRGIYDLWIDSSTTSAEEIADVIIDRARKVGADDSSKVQKPH